MSREFIGVVTKPQALKGQFRIKPEIFNLKTFKKLQVVYLEDKDYSVESVILRDTFVIMKLQGIDTCEQAELLRNSRVYAEIESVVESHVDLIGFRVLVELDEIGTIQSVNNYGSTDIISIIGKFEIMLPIIDDLVDEIDENDKVIKLNKNIFEQVAVYEN